MKEEDLTIFEYRKEKEIAFSELIKAEKMRSDYQKGSVYTRSAGWVNFSLYRPSNASEKTSLPPVFMFHGGGFVLGYYEQEGRYCRRLADQTGCVLINMDYALAPEFKFPLPIYSSYEAMVQILKQSAQYGLKSEKVMAMGNSAGGCIAVDLCLLNRERKEMNLIGAIADYAPLDQNLSQEERKSTDPSKGVSKSRALQYIHWYYDDLKDVDNPLASPARCADLHGLPPMLVISAELDTLRNEEKTFAEKSKQVGNEVTYAVINGVGHGFTHSIFSNYNSEKAEQAWDLMADYIQSAMYQKV